MGNFPGVDTILCEPGQKPLRGTEGLLKVLPQGYPVQALPIVQTTAQLEYFACFYTFYDRASFPLYWCRIKKVRHDIPSAEHNGFYLIRFWRTPPELLPEDQNVLAINLRAP